MFGRIITALILGLHALAGAAEPYPVKPIRFVVLFSPATRVTSWRACWLKS